MSSSDEFRTPPKLFKELDSVFNFFWDACCTKENCLVDYQKGILEVNSPKMYDYLITDLHKAAEWVYMREKTYKDNLSVFMNPPYSNPGPFIKKAWDDSKYFRVIMLLKTDMSTNWFNYALEQSLGRYIHRNEVISNYSNLCSQLVYLTETMDSENLQIGILHLRKRIKFYVSEEIFISDANTYYDKSDMDYVLSDYNDGEDPAPYGELMYSKNYKRVKDGIVSKSSANFPSMLMIFDRRGG